MNKRFLIFTIVAAGTAYTLDWNAHAQLLGGGPQMAFTTGPSAAWTSAMNTSIAWGNSNSATLANMASAQSNQLAAMQASSQQFANNQRAVQFGEISFHQGVQNQNTLALTASAQQAQIANAQIQNDIAISKKFSDDLHQISNQYRQDSFAEIVASENAASRERLEAERGPSSVGRVEVAPALPTWSPFAGMGISTGGIGGFGNAAYRMLGFNTGLGAFSQANMGTFNSWGGPAVTTLTPPQVGFSNFGMETNQVSTTPVFGASAVSPFSVGTASPGPTTTIGAAAVNPWAVQAARDLVAAQTATNALPAGLGAARGSVTLPGQGPGQWVMRGNAISGSLSQEWVPAAPTTGKDIGGLVKADGTQDAIFANNDELRTTIQNNIDKGAYDGKPKPQLQRAWGL